MIVEYSVTLENKTKDELIAFILQLQNLLYNKDRQIDLMSRAIDNYDSQLVINTFKDKEHVKEYFKELAERKE